MAKLKLPEFPSWPFYDDVERNAVSAILAAGKVNYWTGQIGREFERDYAAHTRRRHAVALHNGTLALELALHAFGIGAGDEVITSPRTFIASASAAVMCGASPVFADIDPDTQNITADTIASAITPRTRAVIPVHLAGWPCEMDKIMEIARRHKLIVIEDCAQAHGATWQGRPVGSFGHAAAFSFCQDKIISTGGEGGMLVLDDEQAWARAWAFKDHGKSFDAVYNREHAPGFRWLHESFGTNWRMLEIQAAIGRIQLQKLPEWIRLRRRNALILRERLGGLSALRIPWPSDPANHAFYRFYAFVRPGFLKPDGSRDKIMTIITESGVPCTIGSCPEIYLEAAFERSGLKPERRLPIAKELGETSLAFPVHPTLSVDDMNRMADVISDAVSRVSR
jgi:dTDP-4-amino-4,6-dideoxygalactose transaminase